MNTSSPSSKVGVVIGGSGLIGGTIVNYFKLKSEEPLAILAPSSKKLSIRHSTDIRDYLKAVRPDFVINTAIANIDSDPQMAFEINYLGPLNIARAAIALNIPYIHTSSAAVLPAGENLQEDDTRPFGAGMSNYAKSKLMADKTLAYMHEHEGLDYTSIRLAVVYGNHDHKIQGFHRMLFSIADEAMPCLFTRRGTVHSYTNARKLPYFIHHVLNNRPEFSGKAYNFVDKEPVDLVNLILAIKSYLAVKVPKEIYIPYPMAKMGVKTLGAMLKVLSKIGLKASLPPELMFLNHFYKTQTLSRERLATSSFVDPFPEETVYTRLPEMILYYLTRWSQQNLITTFKDDVRLDSSIEEDFNLRPQEILDSLHQDATSPFKELFPYRK